MRAVDKRFRRIQRGQRLVGGALVFSLLCWTRLCYLYCFQTAPPTVQLIPGWKLRPTNNLQPPVYFADWPSLTRLGGTFDFARNAISQSFREPDYSALDVVTARHGFQREIRTDDGESLEVVKVAQLAAMDNNVKGNRPLIFEPSEGCQMPAWSFHQFPTCNTFHEMPPLTDILGMGHYREGVRVPGERLVLKRVRLARTLESKQLDRIRLEALIMERLTLAPTIVRIFGHCGASVFVEQGRDLVFEVLQKLGNQTEPGFMDEGTVQELQMAQQGLSFNHFSASEKLHIAIQIAESLAELHGFSEGVIVNDDVLLKQWLLTDDKRVILNDFNMAIVLPVRNGEYCRVYRSNGGRIRSPEEYEGKFIDESVDVHPFGSILYSILTGLLPFFEIPELYQARIEEKVLNGELPTVPELPDSCLIARRFVELMELCFIVDPNRRIDIFGALEHLYETRRRSQRNATVC